MTGQVRRTVPEMRDSRLQMDSSVYLRYAGRRVYTRKEPERMITRQERGTERGIEDIATPTARAAEVRESRLLNGSWEFSNTTAPGGFWPR